MIMIITTITITITITIIIIVTIATIITVRCCHETAVFIDLTSWWMAFAIRAWWAFTIPHVAARGPRGSVTGPPGARSTVLRPALAATWGSVKAEAEQAWRRPSTRRLGQ